MANNANGADLIGKVLIIGENVAKYTINSISGEIANCTLEKANGVSIQCPMKLSFINEIVGSGKAHWADAETESTDFEDVDEGAPEQPAEQVKVAETVHVDADGNESQRRAIIVDMSGKTAKVKTATTTKPKTAKAAPKTAKAAPKAAAVAKVSFATYTTKKGKEAGKIMGFAEDDPIYQGGLTHASKTWEKDKKGNRVYCLIFGSRYTEVAKAVTEAINEGATFDECQAIIDGGAEKIAKERAEKKAEYLAKKAEREAAKNEPKAAPKAGKTYTEADVKAAVDSTLETIAKAAKMSVEQLQALLAAA